MNNLETYLASDQARADVKALIDRPMDTADFPQGSGLHFGDRSLVRRQDGAWNKVCVGTPDGRADCFYRESSPGRLLVSDLCGGLTALRLRTGLSTLSLTEDAILLAAIDPRLTMNLAAEPLAECCYVAELADTICRVLLASHKLANLELP